jgi:hypothetical protein
MFDDGLLHVQVYAKRIFGEDRLVSEFNAPLNVFTLLESDDSRVQFAQLRAA